MAKLTVKQERFAQAYIETGNASEAYRQAYPRSLKWKSASVEVNASKMLVNTKVLPRIEQLQAEHRERHDVTVDSLTKQAEKIYTGAMDAQQYGAAKGALDLTAKLHGLLTDKHQITGKDGAPLMPTTIRRVFIDPDRTRK